MPNEERSESIASNNQNNFNLISRSFVIPLIENSFSTQENLNFPINDVTKQYQKWKEPNESPNIEDGKSEYFKEIEVSLTAISAYFKDKYPNDDIVKNDGYSLLHQDLEKKYDTESTKKLIPDFMVKLTEYFSILSQKNDAPIYLAQFPPLDRSEYECMDGLKSRLQDTLSSLKAEKSTGPLEASNRTISDYSVELRRVDIIDPDNHPHVTPFVQYLVGADKDVINKSDQFFKLPLTDISVKQAWNIVATFDNKLNKNLSEIIDKKATDIYDKILPLIDREKEANGKAEVIDVANSVFELTKKIENNLLSDSEMENGKLFIATEDGEYVWKSNDELKKSIKGLLVDRIELTQENKQDDLFFKAFEDIEDISSNNSIGKIVTLIKSENSQEKEVGINILRILAENFKDNKPLQFLSILDEVGLENILEADSGNKSNEYIISRIVDNIPRVKESLLIFENISLSNDQKEELIKFYTALYVDKEEKAKEAYEALRLGESDSRALLSDTLLDATSYGIKEEISILIKLGANVNIADEDGFTPLHLAALNGHSEIVTALIKGGADINKATSYGYTPLYLANNRWDVDIIDIINNYSKLDTLRSAFTIRKNVINKLIEPNNKEGERKALNNLLGYFTESIEGEVDEDKKEETFKKLLEKHPENRRQTLALALKAWSKNYQDNTLIQENEEGNQPFQQLINQFLEVDGSTGKRLNKFIEMIEPFCHKEKPKNSPSNTSILGKLGKYFAPPSKER